MVRVNKKPQHLVFCLHSWHQARKYSHLAVESSKSPCATRISGSQNCPRTGANPVNFWGTRNAISGPTVRSAIPRFEIPETQPPTMPGPRSLRGPPSSLEPVEARHKAQERCNLVCTGVEMWTKRDARLDQQSGNRLSAAGRHSRHKRLRAMKRGAAGFTVQ